MIEPQSGHGGASSSGRNANIDREGSEPAAPTDAGPEPGAEPRGDGTPTGPVMVVVLIGPGDRLTGMRPGRAGVSPAGWPPGSPVSSFTCTPMARCWSLFRNFEAIQRKM